MPGKHDHAKLVAKVIRELLSSEAFTTLSDLSEAIKIRCGRLKIRVTGDEITSAFRLIASNTPLVSSPLRLASTSPAEPRTISKGEASRVLRELGVSVRGGRIAVGRQHASVTEAPEYFPQLVPVWK